MDFKHSINIFLRTALLISSLSFAFSLQAAKTNDLLEELIELAQDPSFNERTIKQAKREEFRKVANYVDSQGFTPLYYAKSEQAVNFLLKLGAKLNAANKQNNYLTALHVAPNKAVANAFIKRGNPVNALDGDRRTPLFYAETGGVARTLIEHGALVNHEDNLGRTPVFYARIEPVIQVLINNGANVNHKDTAGLLCIHYVQTLEQAKALKQTGLSLEYVDEEGNTLLHVVREARQARFLLQNGAHTARPNKYGEIPLHCAVKANRLDIIEFFLREIEKGNDTLELLLLKTGNGENILHLLKSHKAAVLLLDFMNKNNMPLVQLLSELSEKEQQTPLAKLAHLAQSPVTPIEKSRKVLKTIRVLVHNGARINNFNPEEVGAVHQAFFSGLVAASLTGNIQKAETLLSEAKSKAEKAKIPLLKARYKKELTQTLQKRFCGFTPLEAGLLQRSFPIVQLLVRYGARVSPLLRAQVDELLSIVPEEPVFIERHARNLANNWKLSSKAWLDEWTSYK